MSCGNISVLNKLDQFGGRTFSTALVNEVSEIYGKEIEAVSELKYSETDAGPSLTVKIKFVGSKDILDVSNIATARYRSILRGRLDTHGVENLSQMVVKYAKEAPAEFIISKDKFDTLTLDQQLELEERIENALFEGVVQFDSDSLYREFVDFIFKTNQDDSKWFANLVDYSAHKGQLTTREVLSKYLAYSREQGILSYVKSVVEQSEEEISIGTQKMIDILRTKLEGFKVAILDEDTEENKKRTSEDYKESNTQSASSYAGSQIKLYLSTIPNGRGGFYTSEQLTAKLIDDFSGLTDEQVIEKITSANEGSYLYHIYKDLFAPTGNTISDPKTELAILERVNEEERTKLRLALQSFVAKVYTTPLATFERINEQNTKEVLLTNKLVENQTYTYRKQIKEAIKRTLTDRRFNALFTKNPQTGEENFVLNRNNFNYLSKHDQLLEGVSFNNLNDPTAEQLKEYEILLNQVGIIPALFKNFRDFVKYYDSLSSSGVSETSTPPQIIEFNNHLKKIVKTLLEVANDEKVRDQAYTIFESQTNQKAGEGNVPKLKHASDAFDAMIEFILKTSSETVRTHVYYKDNGSKVYANGLPSSVHRIVNNLKFDKQTYENIDNAVPLPYSVTSQRIFTRINQLNIAEYVQHEPLNDEDNDELVFGSFQKSDHFKGIVQMLVRGYVPFARAAERSVQRMLEMDLSNSDNDSAINDLANRLVYEATTAVFNKIKLKENPHIFDGLHFKKHATKLRLFDGVVNIDNILEEVYQELVSQTSLDYGQLVESIKTKLVEKLGLTVDESGGKYVEIDSANEYYGPIKQTFLDNNKEQFKKYIKKYYPTLFPGDVTSVSTAKLKTIFGYGIEKSIFGDVQPTIRIISLDDIAEKLSAMYVEGLNAQFALVFGDVGSVSPANFNKRATLYQSTKQANITSLNSAELLDSTFPRIDGSSRAALSKRFGEIPVATLTLNEVKVSIKPYMRNSLRKFYERAYSTLYQGEALEKRINEAVDKDIDAADGSSFFSLDHLRDYFLQNEATQWTSQHDMLYNYEGQRMLWSFIVNGTTYKDLGLQSIGDPNFPIMTVQSFNEIFKDHLSTPLTDAKSIADFRPQYFRNVIKPENIEIGFNITKPAGTSRILGRTIDEVDVDDVFAVNHVNSLIKTAGSYRSLANVDMVPVTYEGVQVMVPNPRNTNYFLNAYMYAAKIDIIGMPSASKDKTGTINDSIELSAKGVKIKDGARTVIEYASGVGYGKQVDTASEEKNKVTLSTQLRRLLGLNLNYAIEKLYANSPETIAAKKQEVKEFINGVHKTLNSLALNKLVDNLTELGFEFAEEGGQIKFKFDSTTLSGGNKEETEIKQRDLIDKLLSTYEGRTTNISVKSSLEILKSLIPLNLVKFDLTLAKDDIENILATTVKRANNAKVYGEAYIQDTGFGYDVDYQMYQMSENGSTVIRAEVGVPLPRKLISYVNNNPQFAAKTFEERLAKFNQAVETFNKTGKGLPDSFKHILNFIANRTPSQSTASVEAFNIKRFLVPWSGSRIVLPLEFPLKSGSDYDVDKLSSYLNSFNFNEKGEPVVPTINKSSSATAALDLSTYYLNEFSKATKDSIKDEVTNKLKAIHGSHTTQSEELKQQLAAFESVLQELDNIELELKEIKKDPEINGYLKIYKNVQSQLNKVSNKILNAKNITTANKRMMIKEAEANLFDKFWKETFDTQPPSFDTFVENLKYYTSYNKDQSTLVKQKLYNIFKKAIDVANSKGLDGIDILTPSNLLNNEFVQMYGELYTKLENFDLIYSPIDAPYLKELATKFVDVASDAADYKTLYTIEHELNTFTSFMGGDKSIGQAAIANVLHSLAQYNPIRVQNKVEELGSYFAQTSTEIGIGYLYDGSGKLKSDLYNEQITGYVDVAKDPFIMRLLVQLRTYNIFHFMYEIYGIPMPTITKMFAAPGIYQRIAELQTNEGIEKFGGKNSKRSEKARKALKYLSTESNLASTGKAVTQVSEEFLNKFYWRNLNYNGNPVSIDYINEMSVEQLEEMFGKNEITKEEVRFLIDINSLFDTIKDYSTALSDLKEFQRPDSSFAQKSMSVRLKSIRAEDTLKSSVFVAEDIVNYVKNTYLKQQMDNQFALIKSPFNVLGFNSEGVFTPFFFTENERIISNIVMPFMSAIKASTEPERILDNKLRRLTDTIITALMSSSMNLQEEYDALLLSDKIHKAATEISTLDIMSQKQYQNVAYFMSRFLPTAKYLTPAKGNKAPTDLVYALNVFNEKASIEEQYMLVEGFSDLYYGNPEFTELQSVEDFRNNLVKLMILQFGFISGPNPWKTTIPQTAMVGVIKKFASDFYTSDKFSDDVLKSLMVQIAQSNNVYNYHIGEAKLVATTLKPIFMGENKDLIYPQFDAEYGVANNAQIVVSVGDISENLFVYEQVSDMLNGLYQMPVKLITQRVYNEEGDAKLIPALYMVREVAIKDVPVKNRGNVRSLVVSFEKLNNLNKLYNLSGEYQATAAIPTHGFRSRILSNNVLNTEELSKLKVDPSSATVGDIQSKIIEVRDKLIAESQSNRGILVSTAPTATTTTSLTSQSVIKQGFKLSIDKKDKDQGKADLANRLISYGIPNTSSYQYEQDAKNQGIPVNYEGEINENTIAFVTVNGNNKATEKAIDETIENAREVLEAGGTVIMDSTTDANRTWNKTGEALVQEQLGTPTGQTSKGYNYWGKNPETTQPSTQPKSTSNNKGTDLRNPCE